MNVEMNLSAKYFTLLKDGFKDIEVRLLDEKRSNLKVGDKIIFRNLNNTILTTILSLKVYNSFDDLFDNISIERMGLCLSREYALNELYSIYPKEKLNNHRVLAIEIKKD